MESAVSAVSKITAETAEAIKCREGLHTRRAGHTGPAHKRKNNPVQIVSLTKFSFPVSYHDRSRQALEYALDWIPAYREWQPHDPGPSASIDSRYAAMPAITKADIRRHHPDGFRPLGRTLAAGLEAGEIEIVHTSGTSEEQVSLPWNQAWWNSSERASWRLNSYAQNTATGAHREAILASSLNVGMRSDHKALSLQERRIDRFLFLNELTDTSHWTDFHYTRMASELDEFKPVVLEANPSLLARLARYCTRHDLHVYQPQLIIFTYEWVSQLHRRQIQEVFQCPLVSSYGSTESGYVFNECEAGHFHQNTEFCRVDLIPWHKDHGVGNVARLLVSPFGNPWLPLLRFEIGDLVRLLANGTACPCGRTEGVTLAGLAGRSRDVTLTTEGKPVTVECLDLTLSKIAGLWEYQLKQLSHTDYHLSVVHDPDRLEVVRIAEEHLHALYGKGAKIIVERLPTIYPGPSGKYRLAIPSIHIDPLFFCSPAKE